MRPSSHVARAIVIVGLAATFPISGLSQERRADEVGGPLTGPPFTGAPFSASAMTTITGVRADGTRFERSTSADYYRDSGGRVRVELIVEGGAGRRITVQPEAGASIYWLDETTRNARLHARSIEAVAVGGGRDFSIQISPGRFLDVHRFAQIEDLLVHGAEEDLGSRRIAGVETRGRRLAVTVPVGYLGNDRPIEIVDERWDSPELRLVIESRYSDSRIGSVEYRLSNIRREEPRPDLFVIPDGYKHNAPAETPLASFSSFERSLTQEPAR